MSLSFNYIDALLVLLMLLSVWQGWHRGFILGLLDLVRWAGSLLFGLRFYRHVAMWLGPRTELWPEVWDAPVAFLLTATFAGIVIHLVGYALLRRLPEDVHERTTNRVLGLAPGVVNACITAAIASALLLAFPLTEGMSERARESVVANRFAVLAERVESALAPIFNEAVAQTLNKLTIRPESGESVELPYKVADTRPRPELEAEMLELVNRERAAAGLRPVAPDPELREVARRHSADMFARGYFAHNTPEGRTPFDRINAAGVSYRTAGENLALAPTLSIAHTGLMNSPGHRANILRPEFGRLGIGIMDGGRRGLMVTQNFRN
ncbi:MAG TPA: CvpA family protein [Pyrinomonadaceae bacterium]|nr:CvpA family protein [Pyrinomonadaceae bacterium]